MYNMGFVLAVFVILAVYAALLAVYLWAESKNDGKTGFSRATGFKLTLSGIFCASGVIAYCFLAALGHAAAPQLLVLLGLFACLAGDFFLQYIRLDAKKCIAGITCFLAAQCLFVSSLLAAQLPDTFGWILTACFTATLLLCALTLMKKQNWRLGPEKNVLTLYTLVLTFMAACAVVRAIQQPTPSPVLFACGATLFWISDMLLGIWNYRTGNRMHANLNWITYFGGTFLMAWSILFAL